MECIVIAKAVSVDDVLWRASEILEGILSEPVTCQEKQNVLVAAQTIQRGHKEGFGMVVVSAVPAPSIFS